MRISCYKPDDENAILPLFQQCFNREMTIEYWKWRYLCNPVNQIGINLMWDNDILIGHYAVSPIRMNIAGKEKVAALSMNTMVHPKYNKRGIFTALASSLYEELLVEREYVAVFGFPNNNSIYGFKNKLLWSHIAEIKKLRLKNARLDNVADLSNIRKISSFYSQHDYLWNRLPKKKIMVARNSDYLNWRFVDNPSTKYYIIDYLKDNQVLGYCISSLFYGPVGPECQIVDIIGINKEVVRTLLNGLIAYHNKSSIETFTIWNTYANPILTMLESEFGFLETNEITHFGGLKNMDADYQIDFDNIGSWMLSMGDSDVY